jgi:transcriptional regulator with XRE-family HTH domain
MTFGEKIRRLRKDAGMTQAELAKQIHVSGRTVQSYESGLSYPKSRSTYDELAAALGCSADYLRTEGEPDTAFSSGKISDAERSFIKDAAGQYGSRGARQAKELVAEVSGLFAGGELAEEDMDEMMKAIQDAYWVSKKMNRKYVPKKYHSEDPDA